MRRVVLVLCAILAAGCFRASSPLEPTAALGTPFDLKVGTSATVPGGLNIRFDAVPSDSRCPINALCVQAGEAVVAISIAAGTRTHVSRELRTTTSASEIVYGDYAIKLNDLRPHPFAGVPTSQSDYVATLTVSRQ